MSRDCVKVHATATVKETLGAVVAARQYCALVVDENGLLEGILTPSDLKGEVLKATKEFVSSEEPRDVEVFGFYPSCSCLKVPGTWMLD
jgi:CBS domain containing-hemolysin-like protein